MAAKYISSTETTNFARFSRLVVDVCCDLIRSVLDDKLPPPGLKAILQNQRVHLCNNQILEYRQRQFLYPSGGVFSGTLEDLDFSLLYRLVRHLQGINIPQHQNGWGKTPDNADRSLSANIDRLRVQRNEAYGHLPTASLSDTDFNDRWDIIRQCVFEIEKDALTGDTYVNAVDALLTMYMNPVVEKDFIEELEKHYKADLEVKTIALEVKGAVAGVATEQKSMTLDIGVIKVSQEVMALNISDVATRQEVMATDISDVATRQETMATDFNTKQDTMTRDMHIIKDDVAAVKDTLINTTVIYSRHTASQEVMTTNISDVATRQETMATNISNVTTRQETMATNISDVTTRQETMAANISDVTTRQETMATNINDVATRQETVARDLHTIKVNQEVTTTNISDVATRQEVMAINISDVATRQETIATDISDVTTRQETIATDVSDVTTRQETIATDVSDVATRQETIATNISDVATRQETMAMDIHIIKDDVAAVKDTLNATAANARHTKEFHPDLVPMIERTKAKILKEKEEKNSVSPKPSGMLKTSSKRTG